MIEIKNVTFKYPTGREALHKVSLKIDKGDFVLIMGENGAGKTTLVKHFNGLLKPSEGEVFIDGVNTKSTTVATLARKVGLVFQNPDHQFFCENVDSEIKFALDNFGFSRRKLKERTNWALDFFGLKPYRKRSPFSLSGGEKKRVAMASVLAWNPDYIVLDEPTIGQDHKQKRRLTKLLLRLRREGKTIIITTHDVEFAALCGKRILLMKNGRITADDDAKSILTDAAKLMEASITPPQAAQISIELSNIGFPITHDVNEVREAVVRYLREGNWPS